MFACVLFKKAVEAYRPSIFRALSSRLITVLSHSDTSTWWTRLRSISFCFVALSIPKLYSSVILWLFRSGSLFSMFIFKYNFFN